MIRPRISIIGGMIVTGCASVATPPPPGNDVAVTLTREADPSAAQTMLFARYTNRSNRPVCFRSDMFTNPRSTEVQYRIRDAAGETIFANKLKGFIPPPEPGLQRLDPGSSIQAKYDLYPRAKLPTNPDSSPKRLRAHLRFQYYPCEADRKPGGAIIADVLTGQSGWQWV